MEIMNEIMNQVQGARNQLELAISMTPPPVPKPRVRDDPKKRQL